MKILVLGVAAILLAACSPLRALNALVPEGGLDREVNIAFGNLPSQRLDVYKPRGGAEGARPVVVFIYGGSWKPGDRGNFLFVAQALTSRGFVVVVPDYRGYPNDRYPAFMEDAAAAVAWTRREVSRHGGDPGKIFLMGHSAGAHIAAMVAYNERFLRVHGLGREVIRGVIGIAGPYDFEPTDPEILAALTGEGPAREAMPTRFVRGGEPPTLLITGGKDKTVSPVNTEKLLARLKAVGAPVRVRDFPDYNHVTILGRLAAPFRDDALLEEMASFVRG